MLQQPEVPPPSQPPLPTDNMATGTLIAPAATPTTSTKTMVVPAATTTSSGTTLVPPQSSSITPPRFPTPPPRPKTPPRPPTATVSSSILPPTTTASPAVVPKQSTRSSVKSKSHGRKASWEVFDPLLTGNVGSGVWGTSADKNAHPLLSGSRQPPEKDPLLSLTAPDTHNANTASKPPRTPFLHRKTKSEHRQHRKTSSIEGLRQIAQQLAVDKPASFQGEQEEMVNTWGDKKQQQQHVVTPKVFHHRKSHSVGNSEMLNQMNTMDGLVRSESQSLPTTPEKKKEAAVKGGNNSSMGGLLTSSRWNTSHATKSQDNTNNNSPPPPAPPEMPTLTPLPGFVTPEFNLKSRSSEQDPSLHQVEIPPIDQFLMHSRLCAVMDQYRVVDQNFDMNNLVGKSRLALKGFLASSQGLEEGIVQDAHAPIIQSLLECSSTDTDLVLEGFFYSQDSLDNLNDRVEVAVFNSQSRRQFVAVYRGTTDQQHKPVRNKQMRAAPVNLHPEQPVGVFPAFRDAYFKSDLEGKVFGLLDELSEQYPFCDVVMTGHSFGGALATIASLRFAADREMLRVSCHAFGTPKVGSAEWKRLVNSHSNLKVMRVENHGDSCVTSPDASVWVHAGHSIVVHSDKKPPLAQAYRFEKSKPAPKHFLGLPTKQGNKSQDVQDYVRAMDEFARLGLAWVKQYVGEDVGEGVRGKGNEKRQMV